MVKAKKGEGEKEKMDEQNGITAVLKIEMHCEGCATKILKCAKTMEGVEKVKADWKANKLTLRGQTDPGELREQLQERLKKKVELISPQQPKKSDSKGSNKKDSDNKTSKESKKSDDKKLNEKAPVMTAVLKLRLHCMGCILKIYKIASKIKGVDSISIEKEKELVTVTGTMDVKSLVESLEERMKKKVEIVSPKKEKDGGGGGGGNKSTAEVGGGKKDKKKAGELDDGAEAAYGRMLGGSMMGHYLGLPMVPTYGPMYSPAAGHGYPYAYPYAYPENNLHAPQMFSDENPNACSVM
ncbi:hypothetical protein SAY87_028666 [Trapa incisa]|uniref:HMA domain-containing protein n=1 Tax=Trapa incisa TaxID=236973 RepID=A0AAN7L349_9MYRT|nr:hypothetical protein SAY87_028666 [Trapa incisa]